MQFSDLKDLIPHGYCLSWDSMLLWLHVVSDLLITLSYYFIPLSLAYFIRRRKDLPYPWLMAMFAIFIVACGTTHLMSAITIWVPLYWLDGYLKAFTAFVSLATSVAMLWIIPLALKLPSPAQLQAEIDRCKIIDKERQEAMERLQKISSRLSGMIFQFRLFADGRSSFPYCSDGVKEIFRLDPEQVYEDSRSIFSRIHLDDYDYVMNSIKVSAQDLSISHYEFRICFDKGEERWLMVNAVPEREENSATLWHGYIYDITDKKRAENEIIITNQINNELERLVDERTLKLQEMNDEFRVLNETLTESIEKEVKNSREKDALLLQQSRLAAMGEMIGNIAHQWRQPINALNLVLANIEDAYHHNSLTDDYLQQHIEKGERLIQSMSTTIDDFRNFFKSNSHQETFSIEQSIKDVLNIVDASFKNNEINVEVNILQSVNTRGFSGQYRQVLLNIFSNAKDALLERRITNAKIIITLVQEDEFALVRVRDNAGGIKEDIIEKVFDPYFTTRPQGNGIGLYMSKTIIENNMHGKLTVENVQEGAEFCIKTEINHDILPNQAQRMRNSIL